MNINHIWLSIAERSPELWSLISKTVPFVGRYSLNKYVQSRMKEKFTVITYNKQFDRTTYRLPNGKLHREGDLPADYNKYYEAYWIDGKQHRDNDKPAYITNDGYSAWWNRGKRKRSQQKPCVITSEGIRYYDDYWYNNPKRLKLDN